jgi:hypothetical protein
MIQSFGENHKALIFLNYAIAIEFDYVDALIEITIIRVTLRIDINSFEREEITVAILDVELLLQVAILLNVVDKFLAVHVPFSCSFTMFR